MSVYSPEVLGEPDEAWNNYCAMEERLSVDVEDDVGEEEYDDLDEYKN